MAEVTTGPAINITNAEAGAAKFSGSDSRSFNYFKPKGRQASVYEDVTIDVQPDPTRHLLQGWLYAFADGTAGYDPAWTKLKSSAGQGIVRLTCVTCCTPATGGAPR